MKRKSFGKVLIIAGLLIAAFVQTAISQTNNTFTTYAGGFSINLPTTRNGAGSNGTAGGIYFSWRQPEAEYQAGFYEVEGLPLARIDGAFSFEQMLQQYFNKFSARGEKIYAKDITLGANARARIQI